MLTVITQAIYNFLSLLEEWFCGLVTILVHSVFDVVPSIPTSASLAVFSHYYTLLDTWFPVDLVLTLLVGFFVFFTVYFVVKLIVRLF